MSAARGRWLTLFLVARAVAAAVAAALLLLHRITDHDAALMLAVVAYALLSMLVAARLHPRRGLELAWAIDAAAALAFVLAGGDWRSPFYLLLLTALILPATALRRWRAVLFTVGVVACYFGIAASLGVDWSTLETTSRLESFATHLLLPLMMGVGLAYAAELLRRLEAERRRSERLVLEAERRRLARELHDSAKQRLHAAHLVLSAHAAQDGETGEAIRLGLREVEAATDEMDASLMDLRAPAVRESLIAALRRRAAGLEALAGVRVEIDGDEVELTAPVTTHVYHVIVEALINAVRHADASRVQATLAQADGMFVATIADDGRGMSRDSARDSHGLRSMFERADLIGGRLLLSVGDGGGTSIRLEVPVARHGGAAG